MMSNPAVTLLKSQLHRTGGLEKYTWQIAKAFCERGCPTTVLTTGQVTAPFSDPHLRVISFQIEHRFSYLNVERFDRACQHYLAENPTPIVFGLDRNAFQTHIRAGNGVHAAFLRYRAQEEGIFKSFSFQLNPLHRQLLAIEKASFENPDLRVLFTNSHMVKQEILGIYNTDPQKIHVVHNGVEWTQMQSDFDEWQERKLQVMKELKLDPEAYQLLFIGHNYRRKGLEPLLRGLALITETKFQLSVIGKEKNPAYFQQLAERLKLKEAVRFFGKRTDIRQFYQMADALAIPSLYDPFANVTVEALAMGLFIVSSKSNGGHEVLQPFSGTTIEDLSNPDSVAQSLRIAMQNPKTEHSAHQIRASTQPMDFPNKLQEIITHCLA